MLGDVGLRLGLALNSLSLLGLGAVLDLLQSSLGGSASGLLGLDSLLSLLVNLNQSRAISRMLRGKIKENKQLTSSRVAPTIARAVLTTRLALKKEFPEKRKYEIQKITYFFLTTPSSLPFLLSLLQA